MVYIARGLLVVGGLSGCVVIVCGYRVGCCTRCGFVLFAMLILGCGGIWLLCWLGFRLRFACCAAGVCAG